MGKIEDLASVYERQVATPWQRTVAGAQRVMILIYDKELERVLRGRVGEFEQATRRSGHGWKLVDCTRWFSDWMAHEEYREEYFKSPSLLQLRLDTDFLQIASQGLRSVLENVDENTVVGLLGVSSLYGFTRISELIREIEPLIKGRLLVFFPGTKNGNNYRLLDARDGWNYMANGITLNTS